MLLYFRLRLQSLLVFSLLITAANIRPAYAETLGLDFSLPASVHQTSPERTLPSPHYKPLAIPPEASSPPIQTQAKAAQLPPPPPEIVPAPQILIRRDQARRLSAIAQSLAEYEETPMTDQPAPTLFGEFPEQALPLAEWPSKDDPDETLFTDSNRERDSISFTINQASKHPNI